MAKTPTNSPPQIEETEMASASSDPESLVVEPNDANEKTTTDQPNRLKGLVLSLFGVVTFVVATAGLVVGSIALARENPNDDNGNNAASVDFTPNNAAPFTIMELEGSATLHDIVQRGKLNCGVAEVNGFGMLDEESGHYSGFDVDLCRAVAAAIFLAQTEEEEDVDQFINFQFIRPGHWFEALANKDYDLLAAITTHTMERDVHHEESGVGFTFSIPYFYDGLRFGGIQEYVECADNVDVQNNNCSALKICAHQGTTILDVLHQHFPIEHIVELSGGATVLTDGLDNGDCNVIAADVVVATHLDTSRYHTGSSQLSREPLAIVTRDTDPRFSDFVNWVLEALFTAEEQGITQAKHEQLANVPHFGMTFEGMMRSAVAVVGSYKEIYDRNLQDFLPREGTMNEINAGNSGIVLSMPFGALDTEGEAPIVGGTLATIKGRGHLNCGITRRAGFGVFNATSLTWEGFDVDYCRALSAAIFDGVPDHVVFHVLPATERFIAQAMGQVDVLSRITTYTLERDVYEPTSMQGFTFSQPVFYDGLGFAGVPAFAECADNLDTTTGVCPDLRICVNDGTTTIAGTRKLLPETNIVVKPTGEEALAGLVSGECNAIAGGSHDLARGSVASVGYTGDYAIGVNRFSKEPLALVTNQDDAQWSDFVYWVVTSTFYAEEKGITKDNTGSATMPTTNLFGPLYTRMFINAIQAVGSHGDMYARHLQDLVPRGGLNSLNDNFGPQIYPLPGIPLAA